MLRKFRLPSQPDILRSDEFREEDHLYAQSIKTYAYQEDILNNIADPVILLKKSCKSMFILGKRSKAKNDFTRFFQSKAKSDFRMTESFPVILRISFTED